MDAYFSASKHGAARNALYRATLNGGVLSGTLHITTRQALIARGYIECVGAVCTITAKGIQVIRELML
jgi:hypothetical protein